MPTITTSNRASIITVRLYAVGSSVHDAFLSGTFYDSGNTAKLEAQYKEGVDVYSTVVEIPVNKITQV